MLDIVRRGVEAATLKLPFDNQEKEYTSNNSYTFFVTIVVAAVSEG